MKKSTVIKIILSVTVLFVLLYIVGFKEVWNTFSSMKLKYLPLIIVLSFLHFFIGTYNIKILTDPLHKISYKKLFKYHVLSWAAGTFIPGRLGEFGLVYLLREEGIMIGEGTAITMIDRLITIFTLGIFSMLGLFLFLTPWQALSYIITIAIGLAVISYIIFSDRGRRLLIKLLRGYAKNFTGFSRTLYFFFKKQKTVLIINIILTFLKWILMTALVYLLFVSFGITGNFILIFLANVTTMIISLVPITINGLGVKESAAYFLYPLVNVPSSIAVSTYLVTAVLAYLQSILFLVVFLDDETKRRVLPKIRATFRRPEQEEKNRNKDKWIEISTPSSD